MGAVQWIGTTNQNQTTDLMDAGFSLKSLTQQLIELQNEDFSDEVSSFHKVSELVHQFAVEIRRLEKAGIDKNAIIDELQDAREIYAKSVFLSRLQSWPRGYQGDYETIEYLCDGINKTETTTLEYYLEKIALASPIVQQHKNKVQWQSQQILKTLFANDSAEGGAILSIGSGGCRDLRLIEPALKHSNVKLVLNDIDQGALDFAQTQLASIWNQVTPICGDSFRKTNIMAKQAPYNLIVAGGLFDYLPDRYACALLKRLSAMLSENGKICFTNILKPNPWGVLVEYLANWSLIERNKEDFQVMFNQHGLDHLAINMVEDSTSLAGLYEISVK